MEAALAAAIRNQWPWIKEVFTSDFRSPQQWTTYIGKHFGASSPTVRTILDRSGGWGPSEFQALYIACWIFHPVEKGTFMLKLTATQRDHARAGYDSLDKRWTSHLHEHGRSAAKGWHFLKGYHELLVQMEGGGKHTAGLEPHLFLKCEGHTAFSPAHMKSYLHKIKKGKGKTANARLQELARKKEELGLGITERAAENYSNEYKALLRSLGLRGKTVKVPEAAGSMMTMSRGIMGMVPNLRPSLDSLLAKARIPTQADASHVARMKNEDLAAFLESVIIPFTNAIGAGPITLLPPGAAKDFVLAAREAQDDLGQLAAQLRSDQALTKDPHAQRYFQEVVLTPDVVDGGLQVALDLLR